MRISTERPEEMSDETFDLAICCLGYEARATRVSELFFRRSKRRICVGFDRNFIHSYERNLAYFRQNGFEVHANVGDEAFEAIVCDALGNEFFSGPPSQTTRVAVDVSCFDRFRLAILTRLLWTAVANGHIGDVTFLYNVAEYSKPAGEFSFNTKLEPVHPSFVGRRPDPLSATVAVIGLGYEREKALGAAEYIEASEVFAFRPSSAVAAYSESVLEQNALLLGQLDDRHKFEYVVEDCGALVSDLSSLVRGFIHKSSVLLVPLGPKVFALACLLTAMIHPRVAVWRMSQLGIGETPDRLPSEHYSVIRLER